MLYASIRNLKCFECGEIGHTHTKKACPNKTNTENESMT